MNIKKKSESGLVSYHRLRHAAGVVVLFMLLLHPLFAQPGRVFGMLSPKLREFLNCHPDASQLLTNTATGASKGRNVVLYYFYTDDISAGKAVHYCPDESTVVIALNEDQQAVDEFILLVFELVNSEGDTRFQEIFREAASGSLSRRDFALEILREEFKAYPKTRDLISTLKLSDIEKSKSKAYKRFLDCPNRFEEFMAYTSKINFPNRDLIKEYEMKYDLLRQGLHTPKSKPSTKSKDDGGKAVE